MKKFAILALMGIMGIALAGCEVPDSKPTGRDREKEATRQLQDQAAVVVGMPAIKRFHEKRMVKMLYELRDQADLVTYSYRTDMNGNLHPLCPGTSVGFGIPYSLQFTAPSVDSVYREYQELATTTTQQPEPNGLFPPGEAAATFVMCSIGNDIKPIYVEDNVLVSLFPMK